MKQTKKKRELALCAAISAIDPQEINISNAALVISIHELLRAPIRISIPTNSSYTAHLITRSMQAIAEARVV